MIAKFRTEEDHLTDLQRTLTTEEARPQAQPDAYSMQPHVNY